MSQTPRAPQRSCVACRTVRPKSELIRVVRTPLGVVKVDLTGKQAGRGAYLCPNEKCAAEAVRQKKLGRALGVPVGPEVLEALKQSAAGSTASESSVR